MWSQITYGKSKRQVKFWKILTILVDICTPDHIVGKQALFQLCYACLVIFRQTVCILAMELVAHALATATGMHGSLLRIELVMHAYRKPNKTPHMDATTAWKHGSVLCMPNLT